MKKFYKYINTFFVVLLLTFFKMLIADVVGSDFSEGWLVSFLTSWIAALPLSYMIALIAVPIA
jgi:hypothetical protein